MTSGGHRPVTVSKPPLALGQRESRFSARPDNSSNHVTSASHGVSSHLAGHNSSANNFRVNTSQASQNLVGGPAISSSTEELLASSSVEYPSRISDVAGSETTTQQQKVSGNIRDRTMHAQRGNQSSPPKKSTNFGNISASEQNEEKSKMSPSDLEVSRVMVTATSGGGVGSNSNSPKSTTSNEGAPQFTLKYVIHLSQYF